MKIPKFLWRLTCYWPWRYTDEIMFDELDRATQQADPDAVYRWIRNDCAYEDKGWTALVYKGRPCDIGGLRMVWKDENHEKT